VAIISIKQFKGTAPRVNPRHLGNEQAQTAANVNLLSGKLAALKTLLSLAWTNQITGNIGTLYRFASGTNAPKMLEFIGSGIDIVRGATAQNTDERTYYTDGIKPKKFDATMVDVSGNIIARDLGLPIPSAPSAGGNANTDEGLNETTHYICTYVSDWGEESAPNAVGTPTLITFDGTAPSIALTGLPTAVAGAANIVSYRVYRLATGYNGTNYQFVTEQNVGTTTFTDTIKTQDLGETLPVEGLASPPDTMQGLTSMPNGMLAGFNGSDVLFSEPYQPHAFPVAYMKATDSPIVGLASFGNTLMIATQDTPYIVVGAHPSSMTMQKLELAQSCVSKRSIVDMGYYAAYASPDGLVNVSSGSAKVVTSSLITKAQWQALNPSTIHAYLYEGKYIAFYDATATGGVKGGFIIDGDNPDYGITWLDQWYTTGFTDSVSNTLYLVTPQDLSVTPAIQPDIVMWEAGAANQSYTWKSKVFTMPKPMSFACMQVLAASYGFTIKVFADGVLKHSQTVASGSPFRLPAGFMALDWEVEIAGSSEIYSVDIANAMNELGKF